MSDQTDRIYAEVEQIMTDHDLGPSAKIDAINELMASEEDAELAGELQPAGVEYVMEDVVRLEFKMGRTTLTLMGPESETDNARLLVEGAKDLFIQAVTVEQEKRDAQLKAAEAEEQKLIDALDPEDGYRS